MTRTAIGLSCFVVLALMGVGACSSDAVKGTNTDGAGTGGTGNAAGSNAAGGGRAGSAGGSAGGLCDDKPNKCIDTGHLETCDPLTGEVTIEDCSVQDDPAFVDGGCGTGSDGITDLCRLSPSDEDCFLGANVAVFCTMGTQADLLDAYLNCYDHAMNANGDDIHDVVACLAPFLDEQAQTVDCDGAALECLSDEPVGGAGAGGAANGGAGPDEAGAGGQGGAG